MSIVRSIARPLLAAPFILEGVRTVKSPERQIDVAPAAFAKVDERLAEVSTPVPVDSRAIVRAAGAVAAGAGLLYATNRAPRLSAALLLGTTSVGFANRRRLWELRGEERMQEIQAIATDAGLLGGILLAVVDTDGTPSVGWRVNRLIERGQKAAAKKQRELERTHALKDLDAQRRKGRKDGARRTDKAFKEASASAKKARKHASKHADGASDSLSSFLDQVAKSVREQLG